MPITHSAKDETFDDYIKRHRNDPATIGILGVAIGQLMDHLKEVNKKNVIRNERLDALEAKVRELEARPTGLKYLGVWQPRTEYMQDDGVTADGSVWICRLNHVRSQPGVDHVSWQLAVRKGRDGRDVKGTR